MILFTIYEIAFDSFKNLRHKFSHNSLFHNIFLPKSCQEEQKGPFQVSGKLERTLV